MLIKNTAHNVIEAVIGTQKVILLEGKVVDVPKNIVDVILNSYRGKDIEIVSTCVTLEDVLIMEEV